MPRTALITGGAGGIGSAMVEALVADRLNVVIVDIDEERTVAAAKKYASVSERVAGISADLTRFEDRERLIQLAEKRFGQVDILVNNAGIVLASLRKDVLQRPAHFWEVSVDHFERIFAVHCTAPFHLSALVVPKMIARGWGRIVNVTTSLDSMLKSSFYGPSKAALEAFTSTSAIELQKYGVTSNVLIPGGLTATGMTAPLGIPADEQFQPDIMAAPIRWLASIASDGVTAKRFVAASWDTTLPPEKARARSESVVAWTGYGVQGIHPLALTENLPRFR